VRGTLAKTLPQPLDKDLPSTLLHQPRPPATLSLLPHSLRCLLPARSVFRPGGVRETFCARQARAAPAARGAAHRSGLTPAGFTSCYHQAYCSNTYLSLLFALKKNVAVAAFSYGGLAFCRRLPAALFGRQHLTTPALLAPPPTCATAPTLSPLDIFTFGALWRYSTVCGARRFHLMAGRSLDRYGGFHLPCGELPRPLLGRPDRRLDVERGDQASIAHLPTA